MLRRCTTFGSSRLQNTSSILFNHPIHNMRQPFEGFDGSTRNYGMSPLRMTCGELRAWHVGSLVELAGSVQQQRLNRFYVLRDAYGATQLVIPDDRPDIGKRLMNLPLRSFISIIGLVMQRPPGAFNESMTTGKIEVAVQDVVMVRVNRDNKIPKLSRGISISSRNMSTCANVKSLTTEEYTKCGNNEALIWHFRNRSDTCSGLSIMETEREVTLVGWLHSQHLPRFIKFKDGYGSIQCLIPTIKNELLDIINKIGPDDIIQIDGKIMPRPQSQINTFEENGDIEILLNSIFILDRNIAPPVSAEKNSNTVNISDTETGVNTYIWRTNTCGELNDENVGQSVTLCGWLQHCRMSRFFTLRDSYGVIQCFIPDEYIKKWSIDDIPLESVLEVKGIVGARPPSSVKSEMPTGSVEILVDSLKVLNTASFSPFVIRSFQKPKEELRLEHRFLYLRYPEMQYNLRMRSKMLMKIRNFLVDLHEFVEVETPTLFCRTPGGAREFVVPTRQKGQFYALIQSPQQHKQMLMAGGVDRYFQIVKCYRDESIRGDRQPEFTQLDIEVSFAGRDEVMSLVEDLFRYMWPHSLPNERFHRLTYRDALRTYGSDKPDISYSLELQDITEETAVIESAKHFSDFGAFALVIKRSQINITNSLKALLQDVVKNEYPNIKFMAVNIKTSVDQLQSAVRLLGLNVVKDLETKLQLSIGDHLFLAYGNWEETCLSLGNVRKVLIQEGIAKGQLNKPSENIPLWIYDFPLFIKGKTGAIETCHHPFTAPHPEDSHMLKTDPLKVRSLAYDLVLAGNEIGGGSVRAHDSNLQHQLLDILKISPAPLQHLLHALESGCPPHAGIALGMDRVLAIACNVESIRDVIAFPKSHEGRDPLSGAPSSLTDEEQEMYHIKVSDPEDTPSKRLRSDV